MKLSWEKLEPLYNAVFELKGKRVQVQSSLGRHSNMSFAFDVDLAMVGYSGMRLMLFGGETQFTLSLYDVVRYSLEKPGEIEIVELFESKTERINRLHVLKSDDAARN